MSTKKCITEYKHVEKCIQAHNLKHDGNYYEIDAMHDKLNKYR